MWCVRARARVQDSRKRRQGKTHTHTHTHSVSHASTTVTTCCFLSVLSTEEQWATEHVLYLSSNQIESNRMAFTSLYVCQFAIHTLISDIVPKRRRKKKTTNVWIFHFSLHHHYLSLASNVRNVFITSNRMKINKWAIRLCWETRRDQRKRR